MTTTTTTTATASDTTERNKNLIRDKVAAMSRHDIEATAAFFATDLKNHAAIPEAQGAAGVTTILTKLVNAMPDLTATCEDIFAEGDRVVCRLRLRGTQTGPLEMTRMPLPATGREMSTEQIHIYRIVNDKIVEAWAGRDDVGMLRQLGHLPARAA